MLGTYAAAAGMHKCAFLIGAVGIGAYPTADWTIDAAVATPFTAGGATWSTGASRATYNGVMAWNLQGVTLTSNTGIVIPQSYTHAYWVYFNPSGTNHWRPALNDGSTFCFFLDNSHKYAVKSDGTYSTTTTATRGVWQFVIMTGSAGSTTFYTSGADDAAPSSAGTVAANCAGITANSIPSGGQKSLGHLALLLGWNQALSSQDIAEVFQDTRCRIVSCSPPPNPPSPPPAPRVAGVGDDPIFVGVDGEAYEVRGEPGLVFNLVSSSEVSINAEFRRVPDELRVADITETTLGSVEAAFGGACGDTRMRIDIDNGAVALEAQGRRANGIGCAELVHERYLCDLRTLGCEWQLADLEAEATGGADAGSKTSHHLPWVALGSTRVKLTLPHVTMVVVRHHTVAFNATLDCAEYARWPLASAACFQLLRGKAAADVRQKWVLLLLAASSAPQPRRFHFAEVLLPRIDLPQAEVHGLLGQRSIRVPQRDGAAKDASRLAIGAGGVGLVASHGQGEGFIQGHYLDYAVCNLSDHLSFRFSRFDPSA